MNRAQLGEIYARFGPSVTRRARALLGNEDDARDAAQEVFVRALRFGSEFRNEASPMTWLYRVTTNLCLNRLRDESRRRALLRQEFPRNDNSAHASTNPIRATEALLVLRDVLALVPDELSQVAVYYYVDHMNHEEIAGVLGVSRRTVGSRLEAFRTAAREAVTS